MSNSGVRRLVVLAVLPALLGAGALNATAATRAKPKPKPVPKVCNLLVTGKHTDSNAATADDSMLVKSADVANNATTLTTVIRVAKLTTGFDATAPLGRVWKFGFRVGTTEVDTEVADGPLGVQDAYSLGAKVTLDTTKNEVRYSVPLKALVSHWNVPITNAKTQFAQLTVSTGAVMQVPTGAGLGYTPLPLFAADNQLSTKTYVAGTPSCVTVGS
jgi:hypothetical protein